MGDHIDANISNINDENTLFWLIQQSNLSGLERRHIVDLMQQETTKTIIPTAVFLILLGVAGSIGNSLVLIVYWRGFKKGSTRVLVLAIAGVDLFSCLLPIPGEVYDMFHLWDWDNVGLCKARVFGTTTAIAASAVLLLVVAVVRYRKVCQPFGWQVSSRHARLAVILVLVFCAFVSTPLTIVNGRQTKPIPQSFINEIYKTNQSRSDVTIHRSVPTLPGVNEIMPVTHTISEGHFNITTISSISVTITDNMPHGTVNTSDVSPDTENDFHRNFTSHFDSEGRILVYGTECSTDDSYLETIWPVMASGVLLLLFLASAVPLITIYALIGRKAWRHRKQFKVQTIQKGAGKGHGSSAAGVSPLRVFRAMGSRYEKKQPTGSSADGSSTATSSSNTNSTSCQTTTTASSCSQDEEACGSKIIVSTISTGELSKPGKENQETSFSTNGDTNIVTQNALPSPKSSNAGASLNVTDTEKSFENTIECSQDSKKIPDNDKSQKKNDMDLQSTSLDSRQLAKMSIGSKTYSTESSLEDLSSGASTNQGNSTSFSGNTLKISAKKSLLRNIIHKAVHVKSRSHVGKDATCKSKSSSHTKNAGNTAKERQQIINRTTVMLFTISAIYIVGYISHLSMIFFKIGAPKKFNSLGYAGKSLWNFFLRLYYVNCAANPVVYSLLDANFRRRFWALFQKGRSKTMYLN